MVCIYVLGKLGLNVSYNGRLGRTCLFLSFTIFFSRLMRRHVHSPRHTRHPMSTTASVHENYFDDPSLYWVSTVAFTQGS